MDLDTILTALPFASVLTLLDVAGLSVFAASGALLAARKRLDFLAAGFFALITATGGGTLRDLLIGSPVFWMQDSTPVILCVVVALAVWVVPLRFWSARTLDWFDAAGLVAYAVYGAAKALEFGVSPVSAIAAGVITACVGGVIRDITAGVPSVLMRHELYVTAALASAIVFVTLSNTGIPAPWPASLGFISGFALRAAAIQWHLALPAYRGR